MADCILKFKTGSLASTDLSLAKYVSLSRRPLKQNIVFIHPDREASYTAVDLAILERTVSSF